MINYKGVIFDLDGTILDSLNVWDKVDKAFFKSKGLNVPVGYEKEVNSMTFFECANYIKEVCGIEDSVEDITKQWEKLAYKEYEKNVKLKKGVYEYLVYLKENNIKIGIATSCYKNLYEICLKNNKIYDFFDVIVDTQMINVSKKYPDIYKLCGEKLNINPADIIVFEDILDGIKSAKKAGMRAYFVHNEKTFEDIEEVMKQCDEYITDFRELIN